MKTVKRIANVGETVKIVSDKGWQQSGLWKNPHPIGSEWVVKKVLTDNCVPAGMVFVEGSKHGISPLLYEVIED
ncbi:hypothetical protein WKH56_19470 [Priestia sp. SB1]|uniref:hypothetical protein n=1 Tax=Priestia sp. SB1 TaxID=3132359 RepID=UPI00317B67DF